MSNPLISQITGKRRLNEDDVVPVPAGGLPRSTYRDRLAAMRRRRGEDDNGKVLPEDSLSGVLGEAKGDVIPDDAEELDTAHMQGNITSRLNTIKDVVEEPGRPRDPDEVFISPKTALTAPDATPDNMTQLDPSKLPGAEKTSFTVPEVETATEPEQGKSELPPTNDHSDTATRTMDLILGRRRVGSPAKNPEEFAAAGAVTTEAQAQVMLGLGKSGDSLLAQDVPMPPPQQTDNRAIYEAARRWV